MWVNWISLKCNIITVGLLQFYLEETTTLLGIFFSESRTTLRLLRNCLYVSNRHKMKSIPPCKDAWSLWCERANYQVAIKQKSLMTNPNITNPFDCNGWILEDEEISQSTDWLVHSFPTKDHLSKKLCECRVKVNGLKCMNAYRLWFW
jgi:hypothetical protein